MPHTTPVLTCSTCGNTGLSCFDYQACPDIMDRISPQVENAKEVHYHFRVELWPSAGLWDIFVWSVIAGAAVQIVKIIYKE